MEGEEESGEVNKSWSEEGTEGTIKRGKPIGILSQDVSTKRMFRRIAFEEKRRLLTGGMRQALHLGEDIFLLSQNRKANGRAGKLRGLMLVKNEIAIRLK